MTTRVSGGMHPILRHGTAGLIRGLANLLANRIQGSGRRRRTHTGGRRLIHRPTIGTGYRRRPRIHRHHPIAASGYRRRVGRPRIHRHRRVGGTWMLPGRSIHRVYHRRRRITRVMI